MKVKSILLAAGVAILTAMAQTQTASAIQLEVVNDGQGNYFDLYVRFGPQGPTANGDGTYNPGNGITYRGNLGGPGSSGYLNLNNGNSATNTPGSYLLFGNAANGNLSIVTMDPNTPQFLRDIVSAGPLGDSLQVTSTGTVGPSNLFNINTALTGQVIAGLVPGWTVGQLVEQDLTRPGFEQNIPEGYYGGAALFVNSDNVGDPRINVGPVSGTCHARGPNGCVGDMEALNIPGIASSGLSYMSISYNGFTTEDRDGFRYFYQLFSYRTQNALVDANGVTVGHLSFQDVRLRYLSATQPLGNTAVPEPMTMSLLGGALGIGALRKRFKKA